MNADGDHRATDPATELGIDRLYSVRGILVASVSTAGLGCERERSVKGRRAISDGLSLLTEASEVRDRQTATGCDVHQRADVGF